MERQIQTGEQRTVAQRVGLVITFRISLLHGNIGDRQIGTGRQSAVLVRAVAGQRTGNSGNVLQRGFPPFDSQREATSASQTILCRTYPTVPVNIISGGDVGVNILRSTIKAIIILLIFGTCVWWGVRVKESFSPSDIWQPRLILDAGHGGEDGGAVSPNGHCESQINLDIVRKLDQLFAFLGEPALLLREDDVSLHDDVAVTLREKKVSDLKNRVKAVEQYPAATLVSIHQNSYPESKYRGTQVFYAPTAGSQQLAQALQGTVTSRLQPENTRQEKEIPSSVYLMNHVKNRAVLVECGFLTNPEEEMLLQQHGYQCKLSLILSVVLTDAIR